MPCARDAGGWNVSHEDEEGGGEEEKWVQWLQWKKLRWNRIQSFDKVLLICYHNILCVILLNTSTELMVVRRSSGCQRRDTRPSTQLLLSSTSDV